MTPTTKLAGASLLGLVLAVVAVGLFINTTKRVISAGLDLVATRF